MVYQRMISPRLFRPGDKLALLLLFVLYTLFFSLSNENLFNRQMKHP